MDPLAKLLAIEEIKCLKARYFRCVDTRDWATLRSLFTDDCYFDFSAAAAHGPVHSSADAFVDSLKIRLLGSVTIHHGHMPEIEITNARSAHGIWAMFDIVRRPASSDLHSVQGFGHYYEKYEHDGSRWRISSLRLTRLAVSRIEPLPSEDA